MIVVDSNVMAYLCVQGKLTVLAEQAHRKDPEWAAPHLWRSELCNVLTGYVRRGEMTLEAALMAIDRASMLVRGREYLVPLRKIMETTHRSNCYAYDCEFVALAEELSVKLVTCDAQILKEFPTVAVDLKDFAK
jgi:predicted nucleic acid-binding protein